MNRLKSAIGNIWTSKSDTAKINKILARPAIQKVRKGTGPKVQAATFKTVKDFVRRNPNYKP